MKKLLTFFFLTITGFTLAMGQEDTSKVDAPLGLRIKRNGVDYLIYADRNLTINSEDFRKINFRVYFRKVGFPIQKYNKRKYQLITIPSSGKVLEQEQHEPNKFMPGASSTAYPRAGMTVNKEDYDQNFWIDTEVIEKETKTEYYKYANDVFSGLLTAPFKYRIKAGNAPESFMDGDFNIAPFIGWKWRVSSVNPYYLAPFGFTGVTTLNYNSANNSNITDPDKLENGTGITYGFGLSFKFGKISPGFILGWDHGLGNLGSGFIYSDKPWISFSINFDFFNSNKTSEGKQ